MDARLDFLQELGNIGASHAATALSKMLDGQRLKLVVPQARMLSFSDAAGFTGNSEDIVCCIYVEIVSEIKGHMAFILPLDSAINLANLLTAENSSELSSLGESALLEVGNIMLGSYLNALSRLTEMRVEPSVPVLAIDMFGAVWESILAGANVTDQITIIDTQFSTLSTKLTGHIMLLPCEDSLSIELISRELGLEEQE